MAPDRQWFLTKLVGALLALFLLISSCIGAANLVSSLRKDINRNVEDINKNYSGIISISKKVDLQNEDITGLKLQDRENITKLATMTTTLNRMESKLDKVIEAKAFPQ